MTLSSLVSSALIIYVHLFIAGDRKRAGWISCSICARTNYRHADVQQARSHNGFTFIVFLAVSMHGVRFRTLAIGFIAVLATS